MHDCVQMRLWLALTSLMGLSAAQGTTGKDFMCLTDDMLKEAGITNGMHRMMLLNRRNELLQFTPPGSPSIPANRMSTSAAPSCLPSPPGSGLWVSLAAPGRRRTAQLSSSSRPNSYVSAGCGC